MMGMASMDPGGLTRPRPGVWSAVAGICPSEVDRSGGRVLAQRGCEQLARLRSSTESITDLAEPHRITILAYSRGTGRWTYQTVREPAYQIPGTRMRRRPPASTRAEVKHQGVDRHSDRRRVGQVPGATVVFLAETVDRLERDGTTVAT